MTTEQQICDLMLKNSGDNSDSYIEPMTDTQKLLANIWSELFQIERVGLNDNFFALGGHSLLAVQTLWLVEQRAGVQVPIRELFEAHTVLKLAERIDKLRQSTEIRTVNGRPNLLHLRQGTSPIYLVLVHPGGGGGTVAAYRALLDLVEGDPTIYALNAIDFDERSIPASSVPEIAAQYVAQLRAVIQEGLYCLVGWSAGGLIAYEMGYQMTAANQPPKMLALIDSKPLRRDFISEEEERIEFIKFLRFIGWIDAKIPATQDMDTANTLTPTKYWLDQLHKAFSASANIKTAVSRENLSYVHDVFCALQRAYASYEAPTYESEIELFVPTPHDASRVDFWCGRTRSIVVTATNGDHYSMLSDPYVQTIASIINNRLRRILAYVSDCS